MAKIITYKNEGAKGVFCQLKMENGERILISMTQKDTKILKLGLMGLVPMSTVWESSDIKEMIRIFANPTNPEQQPLDAIIEKLIECKSIDEVKSRIINERPIEQKSEKIWKQFKGQSNTDEILVEKARALAPLLTFLSNENAKFLFEKLKEEDKTSIGNDKFGEILFEIVIFYLHFIDRLSLQHLGIEKRKIFMDALFLKVREVLSKVEEDSYATTQFYTDFETAYHKRQLEYAEYKKMFPEKDEGTKDTLFWEFGKKIARIIDSETNLPIILYVQTDVVSSVEVLKLPELFNEE